MNIKRQIWIPVCTALFIFSSATTVMAQETGKDMPERKEKGFRPMPISPEESARHTTDRMDSLLNLTEKQYKKIYNLNLKWAREDKDNRMPAPRMGEGPDREMAFNGAKDSGQEPRGNRPPADMADRRPPRNHAPSSNDREGMEAQREKQEKQRKKREKKLKKILTDEQYTLWTKKQQPAMPGNGKDRN